MTIALFRLGTAFRITAIITTKTDAVVTIVIVMFSHLLCRHPLLSIIHSPNNDKHHPRQGSEPHKDAYSTMVLLLVVPMRVVDFVGFGSWISWV